MAEIKIEKKQPIWPWIVGLLILGAIVYFVFLRDTDDTTNIQIEEVSDADTSNTNKIIDNGDVAQYVTFIQDNRANMTLDHEFTKEALSRLIAATESVAAQSGYDTKNDLGQVKEYADQITRDPHETSHGDKIRKAADMLSRTFENIQQNSFPNLVSDVSDVQNAASAIDPKTLTLDQKDAVKTFFDRSATLLEKMNNETKNK